jgi:outer membrane receptor protein involved in Fe transport
LRWTDDQKHFVDIPSALLADGYGYVVTNVVDQEWREWTGRFAANWTPKVDFTDQTLVYATFGHGYKAGGANPPGALFLSFVDIGDVATRVHPLTFKPEFINAYELGTKNTLLDGALTLNGNFFYYDYQAYQISEIVDRTSINLNFDATVKGAELETVWEPLPGLKFTFSGGYEQTRLADGSHSVDLMDRTAGHPGWVLVKPFVTQASNCVLPVYVVGFFLNPLANAGPGLTMACGVAYNSHFDPVSNAPYTLYPTGNSSEANTPIPPGIYPGFDPLAGTPGHPYTGQNSADGIDYGPAPNNGAGFDKDLSGNELPNAPHFTTSFTAEYSLPVTEEWAATLHGDFYWQASSWARVFNDNPYDRLRGYTNVNFALILTNQNGWQATGYVKNVFDRTAITGAFLNSDDTGLTTNVFLTDPRLFGVRVTKNW